MGNELLTRPYMFPTFENYDLVQLQCNTSLVLVFEQDPHFYVHTSSRRGTVTADHHAGKLVDHGAQMFHMRVFCNALHIPTQI